VAERVVKNRRRSEGSNYSNSAWCGTFRWEGKRMTPLLVESSAIWNEIGPVNVPPMCWLRVAEGQTSGGRWQDE